MEERNTIYLDSLQNDINENFIDILENKLKENEYIVYRNENNENKEIIEEVNKMKPDVYVSLNIFNNDNAGIKIYTNNKHSLGNNVAQKIYDQTKLIYNDSDEEIFYTKNIRELNDIKLPTIYVELKCTEENQNNLINAMYTGIDNYFKNRN